MTLPKLRKSILSMKSWLFTPAMPPKVQAEMAKGFTLYMLKAVLDGRASDLVDLGRTNWLR